MKRPGRYTEDQYSEALAAIRTQRGSLKKILVAPLPTYSAIWQRCENDAPFKARYQEAMKGHADPRLTDAATVLAALDVIKANPTVNVDKLLSESGLDLRSRRTLNGILRRDRSLAAMAAPIRLERKKSRKKPVEKRILTTGNLVAALRSHEFYAVAEKAVPRKLDPWDRDDIRSEMILALFDDRLSVEEAARSGRKFAADFLAQRRKTASLDVSRHGAEAWLDSMSADDWVAA